MEYIIFKNPRISHRKEEFGGLVKSNFQILILGKEEYSLLENLGKYKDYNSFNKEEKKIIGKFLKLDIFLKIEKTEAEKLIKNKNIS